MRAVMVMFDSLNRLYLPPYGCEYVHAPNFERLAAHTVTFDNCYAGSLPCIPARRELHSGRLNFLHRDWSPLEPFDDSMPEMLKNAGIHTHLISDHKHYWEDGGATYHTRYSSWECVRGQEGDAWKADLDPDVKAETQMVPADRLPSNKRKSSRQDAVNRLYRSDDEHSCQREVFDLGLEFIDTNHAYDNWFLQIEAFDPHEPFFTYDDYTGLYDIPDIGRRIDWPNYGPVNESDEVIRHVRGMYAATVSMCDANLGRILDKMDELDLWKDTMLIVNTDHGFMLGEHDCWAKNWMPCYDAIAHIPLFIWDPRSGAAGERRKSLVQTIDMAPTVLGYFGLDATKDMQGRDMAPVTESDESIRKYALFGYHGGQLNITDGRYVYMRSPRDREEPMYNYTLMPNAMAWRMGKELESAELAGPFDFTKNMPVLKIPADDSMYSAALEAGDMLFDLETDPGELAPLDDEETKARLTLAMEHILEDTDAPEEMYVRMGFDRK